MSCRLFFSYFPLIHYKHLSLTNLCFSVPGVIGTLQALEAIKIASNVGEPLSGRMLIFDALSGRIRVVCHILLIMN